MSHISDKVKSFEAGEILLAGYAVSLTADNTVSYPSAANEDVVGITEYDQEVSGNGVGVKIDGETLARAGGTIARGAKVIAGADGRLLTLPTAAGTYNVIGKCMAATTIGKLVEVLIQRESVVVA